jgi:hypothetical protein
VRVISLPTCLRLCLLQSCLLLLCGTVEVRADIEAPKTQRVPVAYPAKAVAVKGFPTVIRLEGVTGTTRPLNFIIRQMPKHGRLEAPVQDGKMNATVRYTANPGTDAVSDTFSFAVKLVDSGASEEAQVTIRLEEAAPVLEAPAGLDLGRILTNQPEERTFTITNKGNAAFQAAVPLPEGWSWQAPANGQFNLAPGERMEATLRVRVRQIGEIDQKVTLRPGTVVRVIGQARPPFLAHPSFVRLQWERGTARRAWKLNLSNNRPEPVTLRLSGPPGIQLPASVDVPANESAEALISCSGGLDQLLSGKIRIEGPTWSQEVTFEAPIAPAAVAVMGVSQDGLLDFGILEKAEGAPARRELIFKNTGGTSSVIDWDPLQMFLIEGMAPEAVLAPQAEQRVTVSPRSDKPGRLVEEWKLRMTGGGRVLQLQADINPEAAKAALMSGTVLKTDLPSQAGSAESTPKMVSEEGRRLRGQILGRGIVSEPLPNRDPSLVIAGVQLISEEPDRLVFEWAAPSPGEWKYKVLVRMLRNHGLQQAPIPEYGMMDNVKVTNTPTGGRAEVTKLRAGARWSCLVVGTRADGVSTDYSPDMNFITPLEGDNRWLWKLVGGFGAVALVLYVRQKWREDVKWKD